MDWILNIVYFVIMMIISYLYGATPFGRKIVWWIKKIDILEYGSGNQGAANVYRATKSWFWTIVVLIFDISKGVLPIIASNYINAQKMPFHLAELQIITLAILAILGHSKSIFIPKFRGGKGVATLAGVLLALEPSLMLVGLAVYIIVLIATSYSSLGSLIGAFVAWLYSIYLATQGFNIYYFFFVTIAIGLVFYLHKKNIPKILNGTESRMFEKKIIW